MSSEHKIIGHTTSGPIVFCPIAHAKVNSTYTSIGVICGHCNKHIITNIVCR